MHSKRQQQIVDDWITSEGMMHSKRQQQIVDDWNAAHPIGTPVIRYKLINPLRYPEDTLTRSPAWLMGGHSAMVMVEGVYGGVLVESLRLP